MTSKKTRYKAYLCAQLDTQTLKITGVGIYSEPPWCLTTLGRYRFVLLLPASGESYQIARDLLHGSYPTFAPELHQRFPLPPLPQEITTKKACG